MINGQIYDSDSQWHPNLEFMGRIDPFLNDRALGSVFLIHPSYIVTATHCLKETHDWNIVFLDDTRRTIAESRSIEHHDITIAKLDKPVEHLPCLPVCPVAPSHRQYAFFMGWGKSNREDDIVALRWGATRLVRPTKNKNIQVERGKRAPRAARGDSGAPIVVLHEGRLYASAMTRVASLMQKGLWHFHDEFECSEGIEMGDSLFHSMIQLDYERRAYRDVFTSSSLEDWQNLDEWLSKRVASEDK